MAVTAIIGTGTTLTHSGFSAEILGIDIGGKEMSFIDASKMSSSAVVEYLADSLIDPGEVTVEVESVGAFPTFSTTAATLTITFSNSTARSCSAFVKSASISSRVKEKVTGSITFQCTGAWS